ncbi:hypothetical protein POV27_08855 [Aureisphaera galaxeae]|uniref:hypothetical protein n=1 Tax=Aureisphaera galaxeae TaxID=1538023 RepID=UPI0023505740|nr:hypothetical protein [Aureisphaera galaxeae]MDC8004158.1 hypothetical protein [Aureisphaera galaxeae]
MRFVEAFTLILTLAFVSLHFDGFAQSETRTAKTKHFIIQWEEGNVTEADVAAAKEKSEQIYKVYAQYLGYAKLPKERLTIIMGGQGIDMETGNVNIPYVNGQGTIHIYNFPTGYFGELAHEMMHAFRVFNGGTNDWFLEEALAEALAAKLFPKTVGFCRYGYPMTVAAGAWMVDKDRYIPLRKLKDNHNALSMKCSAQSYALRGDFYQYLEGTFGKQTFLKFVYDTSSPKYEAYVTFFRKDFDTLEKEWLLDLQDRIRKMPDFETQKNNYRTKSGVQYINVCTSGVDY